MTAPETARAQDVPVIGTVDLQFIMAEAKAVQSLREQLDKFPERVIEHAVKGMLPKNPLGRAMFKKLHVYAGPDHPHAAQQPTALDL